MIEFIYVGSQIAVLIGSILSLRASKAVLKLAKAQERREQ